MQELNDGTKNTSREETHQFLQFFILIIQLPPANQDNPLERLQFNQFLQQPLTALPGSAQNETRLIQGLKFGDEIHPRRGSGRIGVQNGNSREEGEKYDDCCDGFGIEHLNFWWNETGNM